MTVASEPFHMCSYQLIYENATNPLHHLNVRSHQQREKAFHRITKYIKNPIHQLHKAPARFLSEKRGNNSLNRGNRSVGAERFLGM